MMNYTNTTRQLSESGIDTVVISIGSTEQFGPYLPMHIDNLIAELYAKEYGTALNAYVLPTLPFNTAEEHAAFIGTVTVSPHTMMNLMEEIIVNLKRQGFKKFVLIAGHGGSFWFGAFLKHINYVQEDIIVVHPHHQNGAWEEAVKAAGLEGRNEFHGGLLGVCTAMWLCPELVKLHDAGSVIPEENNAFADFLGWDLLTEDGNYGEFRHDGTYTPEQLAQKGETLWMTLIRKHCEGLKEHVEEAYRRKMSKRG
jgi:creatinine amidohydrolase